MPGIFCPDFPPAAQRKRQAFQTEATTNEKSHGRRTRRHLQASTRIVPHLKEDWPGLQQVLRLQRTTHRDGKESREVAFAITSLSPQRADAAALLEIWRGHWGIENREHWVRDTNWNEDHCRVRLPRPAHNLAAFRNAAINLLRLAQATNIAAALRQNAYQTNRLLAKLGIMKL